MRHVATFFEVVAFIGALLGAYQVVTTMQQLDASAIQQAAGIVFGVSLAVIPYCLAGIFHRGAVRDAMAKRVNPAED